MQKGHRLEFSCQCCQQPLQFSIFEIDKVSDGLVCTECGLIYDFSDEGLRDQIRKFENLCHQISLSQDILSNTAIGITVGDKEVKIPYKILLTRLNSVLDLRIGDRPLSIKFRIEPLEDMPKLESL